MLRNSKYTLAFSIGNNKKNNEFGWKRVESFVGHQEPLLATVKREKMAWFGHITRHDSLCKTIMQGTVEGGGRSGRQRKNGLDNVKKWTGMTVPELLMAAVNRPLWERVGVASAFGSALPLQKSRGGGG